MLNIWKGVVLWVMNYSIIMFGNAENEYINIDSKLFLDINNPKIYIFLQYMIKQSFFSMFFSFILPHYYYFILFTFHFSNPTKWKKKGGRFDIFFSCIKNMKNKNWIQKYYLEM